jgi:hypothetical protein
MSVQHRLAEQSVPKNPRGETSRRQSRSRFILSVDRATGCGPAPIAATGRHSEPAVWQTSPRQQKSVTDAMASEGANDRSNPVEQNDRTRICGECGADMKQLGKLPAVALYPAIRVFRCYRCDNVVSEQL